MITILRSVILAVMLGSGFLVAGCGGGSSDDTDVGTAPTADAGGSQSGDGPDPSGGDGGSSSGGGGAGTLNLAGEQIVLGPGRCALLEQPAAAGGGSILSTAQAQGTNSADAEVRIDFTRYSKDSQFAGDHVDINVGPLGDTEDYSGSAAEGTVSIDGGLVSVDDFPINAGQGKISFKIDCG